MEETWIKIEDRSIWIVPEFKDINPLDETTYIEYWSSIKQTCIEGMWGPDFDGYRFMPGNLFFYVNMCHILDTDKKTKTRRMIRPHLRDLEWELAYMTLEAKGFSGFRDDDRFTSSHLHETYRTEGIPWGDPDLDTTLINSKGELKEYIPPRENIRSLHTQPLGPPLYLNPAKNVMVLGSRSGGKSYYFALAETLHALGS